MEHITIYVTITRDAAVAEGRTQYGTTTYTPTEEQWMRLDLRVRKQAASHCDERHALVMPGTDRDWKTIVAAVEAEVAAIDVDRDIRRTALLARSHEDHTNDHGCARSQYASIWDSEWDGDPAVLTRRIEVDAEIDRRRDEYERRLLAGEVQWPRSYSYGMPEKFPEVLRGRPKIEAAFQELQARYREYEIAADAAAKQRDLESRAASAAAEAALVEWARQSSNHNLQVAAEEGYDVKKAAMEHMVALVCRAVQSAPWVVLVEDSADYLAAEWEERTSPTASAIFTQKRIAAVLKGIVLPTHTILDVSRVMRITLPAPKEDRDDEPVSPTKLTGVVVTIENLVAHNRYLVFKTE